MPQFQLGILHELSQLHTEQHVLLPATPTAAELAAKQQQTLHALWQKPKRMTSLQLAEFSPKLHTPPYLAPKPSATAARTSNLKPKAQPGNGYQQMKQV